MTRETRIALVVGLAFIVLFGLVLGQRSMRLATARGTDAPAPGTAPLPRGASPEVVAADIDRREGGAPQAPPRGSGPPAQAARETSTIPSTVLAAERSTADQAPPVSQHRQEIPIPSGPAGPVDGESAGPPGPPPAPPTPEVRTYVVQPGDTLIRIARKVYGPEHEKEYVRIFQANRDRIPSASRVLIGEQLVIPPLGPERPSPQAARETAQPRPGPERYREMTLQELAQRFGSRRTYVVRSGDCLTAIARSQLGDDSVEAVRKLLSANHDRITDPDHLPIGLELRIPNGA